MAKNKLNLEFANFICHFGDVELLGYLEEIVIPAFFSGLKRKWGKSSYFIYEPRIEVLEEKATGTKYPTISGKFVLDKVIDREQIYENGQIVPDRAAMATAPTSFFVLSLRDHKLMFVKEMSGAPGIDAFRSTVERLFNDRRAKYIDEIYNKNRILVKKDPSAARITKRSLVESISGAHLQIVRLTGVPNLTSVVRKFSKLQQLKISVVKTNSELDNSELFEDFRDLKDDFGADRAAMVLGNSNGLDKKYAIDKIVPAADGNISLEFSGLDDDGKKITVTEQDFKVTAPVDELPPARRDAVKLVFRKYLGFVKQGYLSVARGDGSQKYGEKLNGLRNTS
jgi:hypothetical protein